jgi:hypothetical protein
MPLLKTNYLLTKGEKLQKEIIAFSSHPIFNETVFIQGKNFPRINDELQVKQVF